MQNLLTFTLAFVLLFSSAMTSLAQSNNGHVTLANGDRIPASIRSFSKEQIEFSSTLFAETVTLHPKLLRSFGFQPPVQKQSDVTPLFAFQLTSGTRINGRIVSLNKHECVLQSPAFGEVAVPVKNLLWISTIADREGTVVYSGLNWEQLGLEQGPNSAGRLCLKKQSKASLRIPKQLDAESRFEVDTIVDSKTEFQIRLTNDKGKALTTVGVTQDALVVEVGDHLEFGELKPIFGSKRLTVGWDGKTLRILNELGRSLVKVALQSQSPLSISIHNDGSLLQINELVVTDKPIDSENQIADSNDAPIDETLIRRHGGKWNIAKSIQINGAAVKAETADGKPLAMDLSQLGRIWFGKSLSAERPPVASGYVCLWPRGQRATLANLNWSDGKLGFETNGFESQGVMTGEPPMEVFLPNEQVAEATDANRDNGPNQFRLTISGMSFAGTYAWGNVNNPIRWQFSGFIDPVTLNIRRKIEIRRLRHSRSQDVLKSPDRIVFNDGSIIPCEIENTNKNELMIRSSDVAATRIPMSELRCYFFRTENLAWKEVLTRETVQRALTVPRFSKDIPFTHLLIGENGDVLRGNLISINSNDIEFESRFETLIIPRENVVGIVAIDPVDEPSEAQYEKSNIDDSKIITHIDCGNDFIAVGQYLVLEDSKAVLDSPLLGRLNITGSDIRQISLNSPFRDVSALQSFTDWQVNRSVEPSWSEADQEYAAQANELLNQSAPDFEVSLLADTRSFQLSDHVGKVVVINFWESTSQPSIMGIPAYREVIQKFSPNDVIFVAPNHGESASAVKKFLAAKKWSALDIAMDYQGEVSQKFKVTGIPHLTVLDREGVVRFIKVGYVANGPQELEDQIRKLLSE